MRRRGVNVVTAALFLGGLSVGSITSPPAATAGACVDGASTRPSVSSRDTGASPALDLSSLETRLRETRAIGMFTKVSLKNQVDDLLEQFRQFHDGEDAGPLARLRERFDLLVLKVLSLLQDRDPRLARDIAASRERLWALLVDPRSFSTLRSQGRAGA